MHITSGGQNIEHGSKIVPLLGPEVSGAQFTADWTSRFTDAWLNLFRQAGWIGKPNLHFLEIGCFEGRTTLWLLENVLTDPTDTIHVIDTFEGSPEHGEELRADLYTRFNRNITPFKDKVRVDIRPSFEALLRMNDNTLMYGSGAALYDFVFVDGSHYQGDVITDAVLAWRLVRPGGMMVFDDYIWQWQDPITERINEPRRGIDAFRQAFHYEYDIVLNGPQFGVRKKNGESAQ